MNIPFKGRSLDYDSKVRVYRNLNNDCFSVWQSGLVVLHTTEFFLKDCVFRVSDAGKSRAIREKRRNVHAFVEGEMTPMVPLDGLTTSFLKYDCFGAECFYKEQNGAKVPMQSAPYVYFSMTGVLVYECEV